MSENLTHLARKKGIDDLLFERLTTKSDANDDAVKKQLAKEFLVGEATIRGTSSFYDFIDSENANKKAWVCNGSSCLCAGNQQQVTQSLQQVYGDDQVGHVTCLGHCDKNNAFKVGNDNFCGDDFMNHQEKAQPARHALDVYTLTDTPILTTGPQNNEQISAFYGLFETLSTSDKQAILQRVIDSGLRGRGGAGFPTGIKWQSCQQVISDQKYIVCNADEGDPGAFSDRYLLEEQPHLVLFGMLIAGWLTGADTGILYIRDEYPHAIKQTEQAIAAFNSLGVTSPDFNFRFKIVRGAGAYICGEESSLLRSIEGQRPVVSTRPPYPTVSGLFGKPTVVNNVETFASLHFILDRGADAFKAAGTQTTSGTKLISLDSAFTKPGIYEVAGGYSLAALIREAGGFSKPVKALHIGGPLGGLVPIAKVSDLTIDFNSFSDNGFLLGHASVIGIPESMPLIGYLKHLFEFTAAESCGKCFPCRIGSTRGTELFDNAINGSDLIDKTLLDDLLDTMELGSLCALGGGIPLPIKNALEHFNDELTPFFKSEVMS